MIGTSTLRNKSERDPPDFKYKMIKCELLVSLYIRVFMIATGFEIINHLRLLFPSQIQLQRFQQADQNRQAAD